MHRLEPDPDGQGPAHRNRPRTSTRVLRVSRVARPPAAGVSSKVSLNALTHEPNPRSVRSIWNASRAGGDHSVIRWYTTPRSETHCRGAPTAPGPAGRKHSTGVGAPSRNTGQRGVEVIRESQSSGQTASGGRRTRVVVRTRISAHPRR